MGTSKSFSEVRKQMPNWPELSSSVTRSCDGSTLAPNKLATIVSGYVGAIGGASIAGRGGSKVGGRSGIQTAKKLGSFLGTFQGSNYNIKETLESLGLTDIDSKSVSDIINHLIEYCSGPASTIDDKAAKEASRLILEDLISNATNIEEIEEMLKKTFETSSSEDLIIKYFGYYIYEHLSIWFYEHLIKSKNENNCEHLFRQIKEFIFERLKNLNRVNSLEKIAWGTDESDTLIKNIQVDVLTVFQ